MVVLHVKHRVHAATDVGFQGNMDPLAAGRHARYRVRALDQRNSVVVETSCS
jgi:hypothetical protein